MPICTWALCCNAPGVVHDVWYVQVPGLAVVLVGSRKDSETYVRSKKKACIEVGMADLGADLPEDATEEEVLKVRDTK